MLPSHRLFRKQTSRRRKEEEGGGRRGKWEGLRIPARAQQHPCRSWTSSTVHSPFLLTVPSFLVLLFKLLVFLLEDGLSGAPEGRDAAVPEEGERQSEEEAGGGAGQAERRGA